jgi:regulator of nucleoside diphosphate kinase
MKERTMNTTIISRNDLHLLKLLASSARLRKKLAAATVVPASKVPADVVTMNSKVKYRDAMGAAKSVKLVYPSQADGVGCVSVLSPLGTALLGAAVGQELDADIPGAGHRQLRVDDVISQPERQVRRPCLAASDALAFSLGF